MAMPSCISIATRPSLCNDDNVERSDRAKVSACTAQDKLVNVLPRNKNDVTTTVAY